MWVYACACVCVCVSALAASVAPTRTLNADPHGGRDPCGRTTPGTVLRWVPRATKMCRVRCDATPPRPPPTEFTKWPAAQASSLTVGLLDRRKRDVSGEAGRDEAEHAAQRLPPGHVRERLEENGAVGEDHGSGAERDLNQKGIQ